MSQWRVGDTKPDLVIDCFDGSNSRPNLANAAEVRLKVWKSGQLITNRVVGGNSSGTVTVPLTPEDTGTPGTYKIKIYVRWPDGSQQHYPPADQYMTMTVTQ